MMKNKILNLTPNLSTPEQAAAGLVDPPANEREAVTRWQTFDHLPASSMVYARAESLAIYANNKGAARVLIDCPPFMVAVLSAHLQSRGIKPVYAFEIDGEFKGWVE